MLNCEQATALISAAQERPLTLREKMGLRFHIMMCSGCRNFERNVNSMRKAMRQFANGIDDGPNDPPK